MKHIEYGWARRREQIKELLIWLIESLKVGESISWPWIKNKIRAAVDLKPGFEANSVHAMVYNAAKKFEEAGTHKIIVENGVKYIRRIK